MQENTIQQLRWENEALRSEVERLRRQVQQNNMERAIHDARLSQQLAGEMEEFYPKPIGPWYLCVLFSGQVPQASVEQHSECAPMEAAPLTLITETFAAVLERYGQHFFFELGGTVACLLNIDPWRSVDDTPAGQLAFLEEFRDALLQTYLSSGNAASVAHIDISHISRLEQGPRVLYRSAASVAEQRHSGSPVVCVEETQDMPPRDALKQIFSLEPLFWRQIQQHAFYDAATTLETLIHLTCLEQRDLERTRATVFTRMETVLQAIAQGKGQDPMHTPELSNLLPAISKVQTYQEICEVSYDILATLEDKFYTPPNVRNKKMIAIEKYISDHYTDQTMSAASIAEQFKISPSYLSRIFKADMGIGIVEYIHRIRVEAAKKLLMYNDLNMNAVAVESGFSTRWVLTRVFKKICGMTPGDYRSQRCNE